MSSMKELLYDGFIMRMKSELENPMKKDDLTNLLLEVEKFMKYFPDRKNKIEDELLSSMILENYLVYFDLLKENK